MIGIFIIAGYVGEKPIGWSKAMKSTTESSSLELQGEGYVKKHLDLIELASKFEDILRI